MEIDPLVVLSGLVVGFAVGLTGMGGGALMTPILVLFFGIQPLAAVSSDLVAAFVMKPVGAAVHFRRGTVHMELVKWLCIGSVPTAFLGVLVVRNLGNQEAVQVRLRYALAVALLLAVATMVTKAVLALARSVRERRDGTFGSTVLEPLTAVQVRPVPTLLVGGLAGLVVGMTSVGSGSLIIVMLLLLYPMLRASQLVGTDLIQAVPLVGSAALGHLLLGEFHLGLTTAVLLGSIPGVYIGARVSAQAPSRLVRRALMVVLFASGLKLADVQTTTVAWLLLVAIVVVPLLWVALRRGLGLPARPPEPRRKPAQAAVTAESGRL